LKTAIAVVGAAIVGVQLVIAVGVYLSFTSWTDRGQFGDMFGVANALFSGLAFAGLIIAILLQRQELGLQRDELKSTRKELKRSAAAQERSQESLRQQAEAARDAARINAVSSMPILVPFVIDKAQLLYPPQYSEGFVPRLKFVFQNFGSTPAMVRSAKAELFLTTNDRLPGVDFNELPDVFAQIIVPGKVQGNAARLPGSSVECPPHPALTREEQELLNAETRTLDGRRQDFKRFYLFCEVVYDDFFSVRHTATYCMKVRRGGYHGQHRGPKFNQITRQPMPADNDPFN